MVSVAARACTRSTEATRPSFSSNRARDAVIDTCTRDPSAVAGEPTIAESDGITSSASTPGRSVIT